MNIVAFVSNFQIVLKSEGSDCLDDIFKELESMGLKAEHKSIFEKNAVGPGELKINPDLAKEIVYQRKVNCPVCNTTFLTSSVRAGRIRFMDSESDLRPIYSGFDPLVYDVVVCTSCGYAHLNKYFKSVSDYKMNQVKEKISTSYNGKRYDRFYSYKDGIERYKLALFNSIEGGDLDGMRAFLCLKISWLYRGYWRELKKDSAKDFSKINELKDMENLFSSHALEGFIIAFNNEPFPIVGLDQNTLEYLIAELYRKQGKPTEARKWLSRVVGKTNSKRLKEKIKVLNELLTEDEED